MGCRAVNWVAERVPPHGEQWSAEGYVITRMGFSPDGERIYEATNPDGARRPFGSLREAKTACEQSLFRRKMRAQMSASTP